MGRSRNSGYALRDILIGTLLLALSMGIGRALLHGEEISFARFLRGASLNDPEGWIVLAIYGVVSLLVKLPCIWIALGVATARLGAYVGWWIVYCFLLAIFEIVLFNLIMGQPPGRQTLQLYSGIIVSHQLMGAIMLGVCFALRGLGYRLERSLHRQRRPIDFDSSIPVSVTGEVLADDEPIA